MGFFATLERRAREIDSLLCVGLDPHAADLAEPTPDGVRAYCLRLIEATAEVALAYKPNAAFFEAFGAPGVAVLAEVIATARRHAPVILDAKRGDISSTAEAYARAAFETLGADAITISPYLGRDAVEPFLRDAAHGVFLLCKTSNPGAGEFQDVRDAGGEALFERVARGACEWNERDNLGLVVGATQIDALRRVRAAAPDLWILAPGVGAQGADLAAALDAGLREDGSGLLIPVSRGIARADDPAAAAAELVAKIRDARATTSQARTAGRVMPTAADALDADNAGLADELLRVGCVRFGEFTLKSGLKSPIYIDLRRLITFPKLLERAAVAYERLLDGLEFARLAGLPYAAVPIATAISLRMQTPMIYPRKEAKAYGTRADIEGEYAAGERVVVIDDLATTGGSKFEAIEKLTGAGLKVTDVVVLIDRESGAVEALETAGYRLHSVLKLTQMLTHWEETGGVAAEQIAVARAFLSQNA